MSNLTEEQLLEGIIGSVKAPEAAVYDPGGHQMGEDDSSTSVRRRRRGKPPADQQVSEKRRKMNDSTAVFSRFKVELTQASTPVSQDQL